MVFEKQARWEHPIPRKGKDVITAIYHCSIQIISRSKGRSAVGAAAYRSGEKLTNSWDGVTHDYTNKGGVVHKEIFLPSHAPPEYAERTVLWNAVEQIEKNKHAQLAREINIALPVELPRGAQIDLVRDYCKKNFVDAGMCADIAIHDNGTGNPHAHILLTMRPIKEDGTWDDKQRKVYKRDEDGCHIYDPVTRQYACESIATTDWNRHGKAEVWRSSWAEMCSGYLARNGKDITLDHRSYARQGIPLKPTIHLGPSVTEMERRGIRTEKGDYNRTIIEENKMMRQVRAQVTRLNSWSRRNMANRDTEIDYDVAQLLLEPRYGRTPRQAVRDLHDMTTTLTYLQENRIHTAADLHGHITALNTRFYRFRKNITGIERDIERLQEHLRMYEVWKYSWKYHRKVEKLSGRKRERYEDRHFWKLLAYDHAIDYFEEQELPMERWNPPKWKKAIEKAMEERQDCERVFARIQQDLRAAEVIRRSLNELNRRKRRSMDDRER